MLKFLKFNPWFSLSAGCFIEKNFEMIKEIPLDRLLLESDSPSMFNKNIYEKEEDYSFYFTEISDVNENIKYQNHPMSILNLGRKIAELKNIDYEYLMDKVKINSSIVINKI
jgi:Tat protein secretion system quality control protein TatD with DNase activity